eukprot:CAMPEP_0114516446 /NCGR_PEP_ID=MMETSP0109-20121206/17329_1 /TAXON_ID=29199 /ORGANISM="Chlorarachnion reptans, Strain CCCM449" /LENGTH=50 /DNA_ID=CAMNT_0001696829 /DNA_START=451 /DNA_END=599 /DNA_ORIENTATION=+
MSRKRGTKRGAVGGEETWRWGDGAMYDGMGMREDSKWQEMETEGGWRTWG